MPVKRMKPCITPTRSVLAKRYHLEEDDDYDNDNISSYDHISALETGSSNGSPWNQQHQETTTPLPTLSSSPSPPAIVDITQLFPAFERGKVLNFSDLFMTRIKRRTKFQTPQHQVLINDEFQYEMALDQQHMFLHQPFKRRKLLTTNDMDYDMDNMDMEDQVSQRLGWQPSTTHESPYQDYLSRNKDHLYHSVMLESWEKDILWDGNDTESPYHDGITANHETILPTTNINDNTEIKTIRNRDLDNGDWLNMVMWDDNTRKQSTFAPSGLHYQAPFDPESIKVIFDLNDPHMLFDAESMEDNQQQLLPIKHAVKKGRKPNPRPPPKVST
ncbi:hypothetical protein BC941DRAFT_20120 [Chlamydoabsidia padenii]|nr:hypothetical protein BC941DRAFT_20120 [Chlamydoabsidia padenii]